MQSISSTTAAFEAHAAGSRLHAGQGFCAYQWHVTGTASAGTIDPMTRNAIADPSKLRFRWPEESSP